MRFRSQTGFAGLVCALLCSAACAASAQPAKADRIVVAYAEPTKPAHKPLYDMLKQNQALERVKELLVAVRWPRTLRLELKSCDESNAWYEDAVISVCYEYLDDMWRSANSSKRPAFIAREDAFLGPFVDTFLHEAGHAMFDLLKVPLLGREEDAADAIAAYYVLQFPAEKKRRLIAGSAYAYAAELRVRKARDLYRRKFDVGRHVTFADEHGTPAQRSVQSALHRLRVGQAAVRRGGGEGLAAQGPGRDVRGRVSADRLRLPHADRATRGRQQHTSRRGAGNARGNTAAAQSQGAGTATHASVCQSRLAFESRRRRGFRWQVR